MTKRTLGKVLIDNLAFIVGIPLIFGVHWGWLKLQDNPAFVDPSLKRELPIFTAVERYKEMFSGWYESKVSPNEPEPQLDNQPK